MELKLYDIKTFRDMLPIAANSLSATSLEESVRESRCYREIGGKLFMTESDVLDFLTWCSPRGKPGGEPADTDTGQVVALSNPLEPDGLVYVGWTAYGHELELLENVQEGCAERLVVSAYWETDYGSYKALTKRWASEKKKYRGKWYTGVVEEIETLMEKEPTHERA